MLPHSMKPDINKSNCYSSKLFWFFRKKYQKDMIYVIYPVYSKFILFYQPRIINKNIEELDKWAIKYIENSLINEESHANNR